MGLSTTANQVYREYETDLIPGSGPHEPVKGEIRALWGATEDQINLMLEAVAAGGAVIHDTQANLYLDLAHDAGTVGVVNADADPEKDGLYSKLGASGSGSWSQVTVGSPWAAATAAATSESNAAASESAAAASAAAAATSEGDAATSAATATTKAGEASTSATTSTTKAGEAAASASDAAADATAAQDALAQMGDTVGIYATRAGGVAEGVYYAEIHAPRDNTLNRLYASVLDGSGSFDFAILVNDAIAYAGSVAAGFPLVVTGLSISCLADDQVNVSISNITGNVQSCIVQASGAPA
jgi:hypothetical protein